MAKQRPCANGSRGGKSWTKGAVYKVLANRVYLGEAVHRGVAYPGEHAAIDPRTWDKAHAVMAEPAHRRNAATRAQLPALLKGLIFGPNGRPMSPSHTRRRGRIYRYYVARDAIADGYDSCAVTSVPAADVEGAVVNYIQKLLAAPELVARTLQWRSERATRSPSARSPSSSLTLPRFGPSYSPLSRHGSSGSSSSGSTCRRTRSRCGSGPRALRAWSASCGSTAKGRGMIQSAETRLDGNTLVVRIPMRFQRRGGRKRIVAPDGRELVPVTKPQPDGALLKALARAGSDLV